MENLYHCKYKTINDIQKLAGTYCYVVEPSCSTKFHKAVSYSVAGYHMCHLHLTNHLIHITYRETRQNAVAATDQHNLLLLNNLFKSSIHQLQ